MARWYYRSVFDELEDLREYLESLNRQIAANNAGRLLPAARNAAHMMLPAYPATLPVRVAETGDEVVVTAAMDAQTPKEEISLDLVSPHMLEITRKRKDERTDENEGYYLHERTSALMVQAVPLPDPVTKEGSSALLRDGVLEIRLKKTRQEAKGKIPLQ